MRTAVPKGPSGQKRPADAIARAVQVMRIATGEAEDKPVKAAQAKGGKKGGKSRAALLSDEQRSKIAHVAAQARWKKD